MLNEIIARIQLVCQQQCPSNEHVLVLQDTTEVNYHAHNGRFKVNDPDLGVLSNNISTGLLAHAALAISATTTLPFGMPYMEINHRAFERPHLTSYQKEQLPITAKESYRWLQTMQQSHSCLATAEQVTVIGDRESDIYELFAHRPDTRTHVLVRSQHDRNTVTDEKLSARLAAMHWQGAKSIDLAGNQNRLPRTAQLQFRWTPVEIPAPTKRKALHTIQPTVALWAVEVREIPGTTPTGISPIHWRLLTTHPVNDLAMAAQIAYWYSLRWLIEELFRILKQGLQVEKSQFETGIALKKLLAVALEASWKILLLKQARMGTPTLPATTCLQEVEVRLLQALQPTLEGNTKAQQNPFEIATLAWAAWLIARLGGWKPAPLTKRPFGVVSLYRGWQVLQNQVQGWKLAQQQMRSNTKPPP